MIYVQKHSSRIVYSLKACPKKNMVAHGMVLLFKKGQNVQKHAILVYTCPKN